MVPHKFRDSAEVIESVLGLHYRLHNPTIPKHFKVSEAAWLVLTGLPRQQFSDRYDGRVYYVARSYFAQDAIKRRFN